MSSFTLKLLAVVTMTMDHFAVVFLESSTTSYLVLRGLGRLSFPLYAFLIAQGCAHTHNPRRYLGRLLAFAFLSELPFDLCFFGGLTLDIQNVFFTLFAGALSIQLYQAAEKAHHPGLGVAAVVALALSCTILATDYASFGVMLIFACYYLRDHRPQMLWAMALLSGLFAWTNAWLLQLCSIAALVPVRLYNGQRGFQHKWVNRLFYLYYPLHILVLWLIRLAVAAPVW